MSTSHGQASTLFGGEAPEPEGFVCRQCGECCRGVGGILVTSAEMEALAAYLGLEPAAVIRDYLVDTPLGWQVASPGGVCIFLAEDGLCRVHPVKPRICRQWPYLPALLAHAEEFEAAQEACPGLAAVGSHADFRRQARDCGAT